MTTGRALLLVATATAVALTLRSVLGSPVPLWVSLGALALYAGLITWGVLDPSLGMFADVVWEGPEGSHGVALTFDDGPHPQWTRAVLDTLEGAGARATFFVIGEKVEKHADLVREIAARGHLVGVHGSRHDRLLSLRSARDVRADLTRAVELLTKMTGVRPRLYRPAVGQTNPRIARVAAELGLTIVGWSVRGRDGVRASAEDVARRVVDGLRDGAIVLLHDAAERDDREPAAPAALPYILAAMRKKELDPVRLDAWIEDGEAVATHVESKAQSRE
ncbi:MAG: polysaccharide deacetylase family protein [Polyangiaceae bacterium]